MPSQTGGGSVGQSLRYMDTAAPERTAPAGSDLLIERGLIARPAIGGGTRKKRKGGFYPSVMKGVLNAGMITMPLVGIAARKMLSRKGGGKKAEIWQRNKNEAKAILEHYGKPSAGNVQAFALAKRRGSEPAEAYLEDYRKRKQEKAEKNEAFKQAKAREKADKAAEREATKQAKAKAKANEKAAKAKAKANEKAAKAAAKAATKKVKAPKAAKGTKKVKVNAEPHPENVAFWETLLNNAPVPVVVAKQHKSPSAKSKQYFKNLKNAREYLATIGAPTGPNMSAYIKAKRAGDEEKLQEWIETFKTRRPLTMSTAKARKPKKTNVAAPAPVVATMKKNKKKTNVAPTALATAAKTAKVKKTATTTATTGTKKAPSNKSRQYFQNLSSAREYLATIGAPTGPNMSAYVKVKRTGDEATIRKWEENFKTRRPMTMATKKRTRTAKKTEVVQQKAKPLTAVQEQNEENEENEENEMQGYSENFEPESE
jgi:hypothetical protein